MSWLQRALLFLAIWIFPRVIAQVVLALLPATLTLGALYADITSYVSNSAMLLILTILGFGWSFSGIIAVYWFKNHSESRVERTRDTSLALFYSDDAINSVVDNHKVKVRGNQIFRTSVQHLLSRLCSVIAYRISYYQKGATFLILQDSSPDSPFILYAQINHDHIVVAHDVKNKLGKSRGMAGQAIREKRTLKLPDCRNPPKNIEWIPTENPLRFIAHAVHPIVIPLNNTTNEIGVLCVDIQSRYFFSNEDIEILAVFARKIASLYILLSRDEQTSHAIPGLAFFENLDHRIKAFSKSTRHKFRS